MADPTTAADHNATSDAIRARFEHYATLIPVGVVAGLLAVLLVAVFMPKGVGEMLISRVHEIKDMVIELLGVLGGFLGMSWGRGHMDRRVGAGQ